VAAGLVLAATALGCSAQDPADQECLAAFRNAEPRAQPPYEVSPLDDAVRACPDVTAWRRGWEAVPGAHAGHSDPLAFLDARCKLEELAPTRLCRSLSTSTGPP